MTINAQHMTDTEPDAAADRVPEFWPPADPFEPVRTRRIPWLLAPLAAIPAVLAPRRLGPHLANSGWLAAYFVHVLFALLAIGTLYATVMENIVPGMGAAEIVWRGPIEEIRRALAGAVLFFFGIWDTWSDFALSLLVAAGIEAAFWAAALLLVPLYAAGEGAKRTYLRCVKLLLWSTTCQAPLCWAFLHAMLWLSQKFPQITDDEAPVALFALMELWWITVLFRLGGRYGGPKEGPRWQPREPHCESCGYSLVSLPLDSRCPECSLPVRESLPSRRRPPAFTSVRGFQARIVAYFTTTWEVMAPDRFGKNTAVWSSRRAAKNYAALTCLLIGIITALSTAGLFVFDTPGSLWNNSAPSLRKVVETTVVGIGSGVLGGMLSALLILKQGQFACRFGFRDAGSKAVVLFYSSGWLFMPCFLAHVGIWIAYGTVEIWGPFGMLRISRDISINWDHLTWLACLTPALTTLVMSFNHLRLMLRRARFANA